MRPTRATQPYRQGPRQPGAALDAMLRGATAGDYNPADIARLTAKLHSRDARVHQQVRAARRAREKRPERPMRQGWQHEILSLPMDEIIGLAHAYEMSLRGPHAPPEQTRPEPDLIAQLLAPGDRGGRALPFARPG